MINKSAIALKMIGFYKGNKKDIGHFLKVHSYAAMIGELEHLDTETMETLRIAAIVHDIACPLCREKYGNTDGKHQQEESEALLRPFLAEFELPYGILERVVFLVTHHHSYTGVEGADWQILLEADYIVNAEENAEKYLSSFGNFRKNVFRTRSGKQILDSVFPENK